MAPHHGLEATSSKLSQKKSWSNKNDTPPKPNMSPEQLWLEELRDMFSFSGVVRKCTKVDLEKKKTHRKKACRHFFLIFFGGLLLISFNLGWLA